MLDNEIAILYKPEDEIWLYKNLDFGNSKEALILVKDKIQNDDDYGFITGRYVIFKDNESDKWLLGFAPADKESGYTTLEVLKHHCNYYMTLGEFKQKYGTNLI